MTHAPNVHAIGRRRRLSQGPSLGINGHRARRRKPIVSASAESASQDTLRGTEREPIVQAQPLEGASEEVEHTWRVKQVPMAHVFPAPQGPTTCETVHGPASGGMSPPHARVSMHWNTSMQVPPVVHSASAVQAPLGKQSGPA